MIIFRSVGESKKRTKRVSQSIGEQIVQKFANNQNIVINGEWYNVADIEAVHKINKDNGYSSDFVEQQERQELANPEERKYLESAAQLTTCIKQ